MRSMNRSAAFAVMALVGLGSARARAQEGPAESSPRPWIESVAVEGTRHESVRRIVTSEARLTAGRELSEQEIRDAVRRVKRLPFILDARPSLRRGTSPGRYQLVIEVEEDTKVGLSVDVSHDRGGFYSSTLALAEIGVDQFVGASSQISGFVSASGRRSALSSEGIDWLVPEARLQFRRYDLAGDGTQLRLSASVSRFSGGGDESAGASFLLPLGGNHSVSFGGSVYRSHGFFLDEAFARSAHTFAVAGVTWVYDTTDDPASPLEGTRVAATAAVNRSFGGMPSYMVTGFTAHASASASRAVPLGRSLAFEHHVALSRYLIGPSFDDLHGAGGGTLRYVKVGRRNHYRIFAEASLSGSLALTPAGDHLGWRASAAAGLRSRFAVVTFRLSHSLGDGR